MGLPNGKIEIDGEELGPVGILQYIPTLSNKERALFIPLLYVFVAPWILPIATIASLIAFPLFWPTGVVIAAALLWILFFTISGWLTNHLSELDDSDAQPVDDIEKGEESVKTVVPETYGGPQTGSESPQAE